MKEIAVFEEIATLIIAGAIGAVLAFGIIHFILKPLGI